MISKEINKKIVELLHSRLNLINGELLSSEELQKEVEGAAKEITDMVFKEISSLPTIKGWVARDANGIFVLYEDKPYRRKREWMDSQNLFLLDDELLPDLKWEDEPIEVELPIIRK